MGGFKKEEPYYIGRSHIKLDYDIEWYCDKLLPRINKWQAQSRAPNGDGSTCAQKFLNQMLPWLVQVLVQDGIYFIVDFPDHAMSDYLKVCVSLFLLLFILCCWNVSPFEGQDSQL